MRRALLILLVVPLALTTAAPVAAQGEGDLSISSVQIREYPDLTAVVTAPAAPSGGSFDADDFQVLENGAEVPFSVEPVATSNLEVILVIDVSGSMDGAPLAAAKSAAVDFLAAMPAQVGVGAVSFGNQPSLLQEPTEAHDDVAARINQLFVSGETALYDAVVFAAGQFSDDETDRALIVLSDGGDTVSARSLADAQEAVAGLRIEVIELVTFESDRGVLEQIAAAGGGDVSSTENPAALSDLYRLAAEALVNQYRIGYSSQGSGSVELTVRLTAFDAGVLEASTRVELPDGDSPTATETGAAAPSASSGSVVRSASDAPLAMLVVGAAALFAALLLIGVLAASGDPVRRRVRAGLGLRRPSVAIDRETAGRLKERSAAAMDRFLERQGRQQSVETALDVAGISLRPGEFILLAIVVAAVAAFVGLTVAGLLGAVLFVILVPLVARAVVSSRVRKRREQFADLLPDNLQVLTSSLRAGYGLMQALDSVAREGAEPAAGEFRRVILETRVGRDVIDALRALGDRMQSNDFNWVVSAIHINQDIGGDLAEILDTVGDTIRERQRLHRQVRTLTAEGRLSAYILTGLPPVVVVAFSVIDPDYVSRLTSGGPLVAVLVGAGLLGVGWVWMSRLIRIDY